MVLYLPRNGGVNPVLLPASFRPPARKHTSCMSFRTTHMISPAPQSDSTVTDITKPLLFWNAMSGDGATGVVEVTSLPVFASPKALCWKSVTALSEDFCCGDIDPPICAFTVRLRYCLQRLMSKGRKPSEIGSPIRLRHLCNGAPKARLNGCH